MSAVMGGASAARLATVGRGFAQPVHAAQQTFRALLEAMSRPGRIQALPDTVLVGIEPPGLPRGLTALLLTLLDAETSLWIDDALAGEHGLDYLRFHTGVRTLSDAGEAAFAVGSANRMPTTIWSALNAGTDEVPQSGATLLIEVPSLPSQRTAPGATPLLLRGPGIESEQTLAVGGLDAAFWQARAALEGEYPRGIDLILCCGDTLAAIPRTTRVTVEG
jgi:alpha-D-ribose 1-methylphosphonate 5-triphosphate synthase subunit PhnH